MYFHVCVCVCVKQGVLSDNDRQNAIKILGGGVVGSRGKKMYYYF